MLHIPTDSPLRIVNSMHFVGAPTLSILDPSLKIFDRRVEGTTGKAAVKTDLGTGVAERRGIGRQMTEHIFPKCL